MQKLIIYPSFTLGPRDKISALDVYLLSSNNIFDMYSAELSTPINTRMILNNYFSLKYNPEKIPDMLFNTHCIILMHVFLKIITEYKITDIYIYNLHFFDIFYKVFENSPNFAKYNDKITLMIDSVLWQDDQYIKTETQISKLGNYKQFKNIIYTNQLPQKPLNILIYNLSDTFNNQYNVECNIMYFEMLSVSTYRQQLMAYFNEIYLHIKSIFIPGEKHHTVGPKTSLDTLNATTTVSPRLDGTLIFNFNIYIYLHTILPQNYLFIIDALGTDESNSTTKNLSLSLDCTETNIVDNDSIDILNDYLPFKYSMVDIQIELVKFKLLTQKLSLRHILNFNVNYV